MSFPVLDIEFAQSTFCICLIVMILICDSCMQTGFLRIHQFQRAIFHLMSNNS